MKQMQVAAERIIWTTWSKRRPARRGRRRTCRNRWSLIAATCTPTREVSLFRVALPATKSSSGWVGGGGFG